MVKRIVDTDFWTSMEVIDTYSVEDKFFALYLMTNGKSTQVGIYSLPKKVISFETGFTIEVVQVLLDRFSNDYGQIIYSEKTQEVTLLKSLSYSVLTGGKPVKDLLERELREVVDSSLILETYASMLDYWDTSSRKFDQTIKKIFEDELIIRGLLNIDNQNQNDNQKNSQKHNHKHNENHSHNHNQDSSIPTRNTTRDIITNDEEEIVIERYIKYLKHKRPELDDVITTDEIVYIFYRELFGEVTPEIQKSLNDWESKLTTSLILEALVRSEGKFKPISYANTVINNWLKNGVQNTKDVARLDRLYNRDQ